MLTLAVPHPACALCSFTLTQKDQRGSSGPQIAIGMKLSDNVGCTLQHHSVARRLCPRTALTCVRVAVASTGRYGVASGRPQADQVPQRHHQTEVCLQVLVAGGHGRDHRSSRRAAVPVRVAKRGGVGCTFVHLQVVAGGSVVTTFKPERYTSFLVTLYSQARLESEYEGPNGTLKRM